MRNLVICDDEINSQNLLVSFLERYCNETGELFNITIINSGEILIKDLSENADILLLDIKMGQLSGMEAARILRKNRLNVKIIFITSMTQYALEGYEVHAFGFLKKPVSYDSFKRQLSEALLSLDKQEGHIISLNQGSTIFRINTNEILYFEAFKHEIQIFTFGGIQKCSTPLIKLEELVRDDPFFRCHKGFLVNFRYIKKINKDSLTMSNKIQIPLSKHRRKEFLIHFSKYAGER